MILINDDCRKVLKDVLNDTENPIIVSDPPFNIGYRYRKYKDRMPENEYSSLLAEIFGGGCQRYRSLPGKYMQAVNRNAESAGEGRELGIQLTDGEAAQEYSLL